MADSSSVSLPKARIIENFVITWLDPQVDEFKNDYEKSIRHLRNIVNSIELFNEKDQCINFLYTIKDERIFVIVSGGFGQQIIEELQKIRTIVAVYIFCFDEKKHSKWTKNYSKIKKVFTDIQPLCEMLKTDVRQSNSDLVSFNVITSSTKITDNSLNQLNQVFMYSQLLKEILVEMTYDDNVKDELIKFCRLQYEKNQSELDTIEEFEKFYPRKSNTNKSSPIWWYTRESFIYSMLNRALRTQDIEIIIKMGFFVRDLHEHIKKLHSQSDKNKLLIVYRGQGMLPEDVQELEKSKGGLLAFNNFLSTTTDQNISRGFVERALENPEHVALHFIMQINPKISSTPFASINQESYYDNSEQEILFSMHTVFRIDDIKRKNERLWEVYLTLTSDHDQQLTKVADFIRSDLQGRTGWHRLACLLTKMGEYDKSLHVYETLLQRIVNEDNWEELSHLCHQLGYIWKQKGDLSQALIQYQKSLDIQTKYYSSDDPQLTPTYSNIGEIYRLKHDLKRALEYFQRALDIEQKSNKPNQLKIASYYNNIGMIASEQGKHAAALDNYENTLKIKLQELPPFHPSLATTYNNIGSIHFTMRDYSNAYSYFQKALEVEEKVLPSTHDSLAVTHKHLAFTLSRLNRNHEALKHSKQALEIARCNYKSDHQHLKAYEDDVKKLTELQ